MLIKECFVENFGVLHEYSFCPDKHFSGIYAKNGSGKTTFAAFVCAMFYGLAGTRVRKNLEEAQRKKYKPWQHGVWGGWISFEANGKNYRIERTFSDKEREDTFLLVDTDTGDISTDYTENIGEELFGMTRQNYLATSFMSWKHMSVTVSDTMKIGLSDMIQDNALKNCESAISKLEEEYKTYKKSGNRGRLAQLTEEINNVSMQEWEISKKKKEKPDLNTVPYIKNVFTKEEEEKLMLLDDYFAAGLLDLKQQEEKLENIRQNYFSCKNKIRNVNRIFNILECFIAAAAVILIVMSAVVGNTAVAAVVFVFAVFICAGGFFLKLRKDKKNNMQLQRLKNQEDEEQTNLLYAREYRELSQKEELCKNMQERFLKQQQQEKKELLDKQHMNTVKELKKLHMEKEEILHRMEVIEKTKMYLAEAKKNYVQHLVKDVAGLFYEYLSAFDKELAENVTLNAAYEILVTDHGILREIDYYSSGIKDIIWFCERMAFAYRLSQKEKPVMILDDIFLTLDDNMQKKAAELLLKISEDFQVIYLSCHENVLVKNHDMKYN